MNRLGMFGTAFCATLLASTSTFALPKAGELVGPMGMGINIGNTMEVPVGNGCSDMTCWGNPYPTQAYIDSLKAAGFNTVRIPCAWDSHSNNGTINSGWMDSVKTVVDRVLSTGAFAILNIHWDGGWFERNATTYDASRDNKLKNFWTQIATKFRDYNERLLFAGANEPGLEDNDWNSDAVNVLNKYYTSFIAAVRATGGNNATRTLIVQAPGADIEISHNFYAGKMPSDPSGTGYLMFEPHFYPYNWATMEEDADWGYAYYYWGSENLQSDDYVHNVGWNLWTTDYYHWCDAYYIDSVFSFMKQDFVDKGYPVVIGEFGSIKRIDKLSGNAAHLEAHYKSRGSYYNYVAKSARSHGIVPIAWDTGDEGNNNMTIIRRQIHKHGGIDGSVIDTYVLNGMRNAYGLGDYVNNGVKHVNDFITGNNATALNIATTTAIQFVREGDMVRSNASIRLYDMNGNLIRTAKVSAGQAQMNLQGMRHGMYIAQSGHKTLKILLH